MNTEIKIITSADDPVLPDVKKLFELLYYEMTHEGLQVSLIESGSTYWLEGVTRLINKMGILIVSVSDGKVTGFAQGTLKFIPDYLGSFKVGFINHLFVKPDFRKSGTGTEMAHTLIKWFEERKVHSIELQVVIKNEAAKKFWKNLGFIDELIQMRRLK